MGDRLAYSRHTSHISLTIIPASSAMKHFMMILFCIAMTTAAGDGDFLGSLDISELAKRHSNPGPTEVHLQCNANSMCLGFSKKWLDDQWGVIGIEQLSLKRRCDASAIVNETHILLCTEEGKMTSCGTQFKQNDTHVTFFNNVHILLNPDAPGALSFAPMVRASVPWECTYPMQLLVGVEFVPQISPVTVFIGNKTGYGKFEAAMFLFKDPDFQDPYDATPQLEITDRLRVKVQLLNGPQNSRVQIVKCWGTPVAYPREDDLSYTLIDNYCPSLEGMSADVQLRNNGDLQHSLWESNVFRFVASPQVYLHCHVKVCFSGSQCEKKCAEAPFELSRRKRRDLPSTESDGLLSLGPLNVANDVPGLNDGSASETNQRGNTTYDESARDAKGSLILGMPRIAVYVMIGALGLICMVLTTSVIAVLFQRTRKRKQDQVKQYWQNQAAARSRLSPRFTLSGGPAFEIPISVPNTIANPERRGSGPT